MAGHRAAGVGHRLVRTQAGEIRATYELQSDKRFGEQERFSGLLYGGSVYLLNHDTKQATRIHPPAGELQLFLERPFYPPFVILLDRKRAEAKCDLGVVKQDEWYTYIAAKQKYPKESFWEPDFGQAWIVLLNKATDAVPKDMPRQLVTGIGSVGQTIFDIKSWRLNAPDGPKPEEFTKPENRPGWEVSEWPPKLSTK